MGTVLRDGARPSRREMRKFVLHLVPGLIHRLVEIGREFTRWFVGIVRKHGQWDIAQNTRGGGLRGAGAEGFQLSHSLTRRMEIAVRSACRRLLIAEAEQARNTERRRIFQELRLALPASFHAL